MTYHSDNYDAFNTWDTPHYIQQNGGELSSNGNLAQLQPHINMYYQ